MGKKTKSDIFGKNFNTMSLCSERCTSFFALSPTAEYPIAQIMCEQDLFSEISYSDTMWYCTELPRHTVFSSVAQLCPTLCDPMNRSTPGLPVHHQLPEFTQTHVHRVSDAIQSSHPGSSPSPAPNPSQHQSLFQ